MNYDPRDLAAPCDAEPVDDDTTEVDLIRCILVADIREGGAS